jgi:hypothetical protein
MQTSEFLKEIREEWAKQGYSPNSRIMLVNGREGDAIARAGTHEGMTIITVSMAAVASHDRTQKIRF